MSEATLVAQLLLRCEERAGLVFAPNRAERVLEMAQRAAKAHGLPVQALLGPSPSEPAWRTLLELLTVGETYFHRDVAPVEFALAQLANVWRATVEPIRIWSAGCSTGEEAYSVAMLLAGTPFEPRVEVIGTDLSEASVARARAGVYRTWSLRGERIGEVHPFLEPQGEHFRVVDRIRARVRFERRNLVEDATVDGCDLILCRNVLLYFSRERTTRIVAKLGAALKPHGLFACAATDPIPDPLPEGLVRVPGAPSVVIARGTPTTAAPRPSSPPPRAPVAPAPASRTPVALPRVASPTPRAASPRPAPPRPAPVAPKSAEESPSAVRALLERSDVAGARAMVDRLLVRHAMDPLVHVASALTALAEGAAAVAEPSVERALYLDPDVLAARWLRAVLMARRGKPTRAAADLRRLQVLLEKLPPNTPIALTEHDAESMRRDVEALLRHLQ